MAKFKIGDKVRCIKQSQFSSFYVDMSKIYTIEFIQKDGDLSFKELKNYLGYVPSRFILSNSHIIKKRLGVK